jgi:hypothetical protein
MPLTEIPRSRRLLGMTREALFCHCEAPSGAEAISFLALGGRGDCFARFAGSQ